MPHDAKGQPIEVGDIVTVRCRVTTVQIGEDYCNLSLVTCAPMHPSPEPSALSLNAKQVEVVEKGRGYGEARSEPGATG